MIEEILRWTAGNRGLVLCGTACGIVLLRLLGRLGRGSLVRGALIALVALVLLTAAGVEPGGMGRAAGMILRTIVETADSIQLQARNRAAEKHGVP